MNNTQTESLQNLYNSINSTLKSLDTLDDSVFSVIVKEQLQLDLTRALKELIKYVHQESNKSEDYMFDLTFQSLLEENASSNFKYFKYKSSFILEINTNLKRITKVYVPVNGIKLASIFTNELELASLQKKLEKLNYIMQVTELTQEIIDSVFNPFTTPDLPKNLTIKGFKQYLNHERRSFLAVEYNYYAVLVMKTKSMELNYLRNC